LTDFDTDFDRFHVGYRGGVEVKKTPSIRWQSVIGAGHLKPDRWRGSAVNPRRSHITSAGRTPSASSHAWLLTADSCASDPISPRCQALLSEFSLLACAATLTRKTRCPSGDSAGTQMGLFLMRIGSLTKAYSDYRPDGCSLARPR